MTAINVRSAVSNPDFVVIATPTYYDVATNRFDKSSVRGVAQKVRDANSSATIMVKLTIPIGIIDNLRLEMNCQNVFFSPDFLRDGQALISAVVATNMARWDLLSR